MCATHLPGMVCFLCSDQVPWWRDYRGGLEPYCQCNTFKRWARDYDACISCHLTTARHTGKGLCSICRAKSETCVDCGKACSAQRCRTCQVKRLHEQRTEARTKPLRERYGVTA